MRSLEMTSWQMLDDGDTLDFRNIGDILQSLQAKAVAAEAHHFDAQCQTGGASDSMGPSQTHLNMSSGSSNFPAYSNMDEYGELLATDFDPV